MGRWTWRGVKGLLWCLGTVCAAAAGLAVALAVALGSSGGTAWVLARVPGLEVVQPRGALLGTFEARGLVMALPRGSRLSLNDLTWSGWMVRRESRAAWGWAVGLGHLSVRELDLQWHAAPDSGPLVLPSEVTLPVWLSLPDVGLQRVSSNLLGEAPLTDVRLALHGQQPVRGGPSPVFGHTLRLDSLVWQGWRLQGQMDLGAQAPLPLQGRIQAVREPVVAGQGHQSSGHAELRLSGTLARWRGQFTGEVLARTGAEPQQLGGQLEIDTASPWPLLTARVDLRRLDLNALAPAWPSTGLTGTLSLGPKIAGNLMLVADLRNERAGAWDTAHVPVLSLDLQADVATPASVQALGRLGRMGQVRMRLTLPTRVAASPSQVSVSGGWNLDRRQDTALDLRLQSVDLRALHGAAPSLRIGGQGRVSGQKDGAWQGRVSLQGEDPDGPRRTGAPAGWVGPDRLSAQADLTLLPSGGDAEPSVSVQATLDPSVWWGVATQGRLSANYQPRASSGRPLGLTLSVEGSAGGNTLDGRLRWPARWEPGQPWQVPAGADVAATVAAPDLAKMAPWFQAFGGQKLSGALEGQGRWTATSGRQWITQGQWTGRELQARWSEARALQMGALRARWSVGSGEGSAAAKPWQVDLDVARAEVGGVGVPQLEVRLQGGMAQHHLSFNAQLDVPANGPGVKPAGPAARQAVLARLEADGRWLGSSEAGWTGRIERVKVSPLLAPGAAARASAGSDWLQLDALPLSWRQREGVHTVEAGPAPVVLVGTRVDLRELKWSAGGTPPAQTRLRVSVPALKVADVLKHWPMATQGFAGDLVLQGLLELDHVAGRPWRVDASLLRSSGDLAFNEDEVLGASPQRLGIRELQLGLTARDGLWTWVQKFDARLAGRIDGRQTLRPLQPESLPALDSVLAGEWRADVANLRTLAAWLPPGWRLGGRVQADTRMSGTLGAPRFQGQIQGQGIGVNNVLLGVNVADGEVLARLDGQELRIERFTATDGLGGGTLALTGGARFDQGGSARLKLELARFVGVQRVDTRLRLSGNAELQIDPAVLSVQGQFRVDEGLIDVGQPSVPMRGEDVTVINRPGVVPQPVSDSARRKPASRTRDVRVDVAVDLGPDLRLKGRGLATRLTGQLRATTPAGRLRVTGGVSTAGGTFAAYGQTLSITRGRVTFSGPLESPRLDVEAMRPQSPLAQASDVKVGVQITGTANDPRVKLTSEPAMSDTEKLSWLVLGRGTSGLAGADFAVLRAAASALLGDNVLPNGGFLSRFGVDEFSVRQSTVTTGDTVVTLGRRISERWYLGFEQSVSGAETHWQLIYRLGQRLTVRIQSGTDTALDFIWAFVWDRP